LALVFGIACGCLLSRPTHAAEACPDIVSGFSGGQLSLLEIAVAAAKNWGAPPEGSSVAPAQWPTLRDQALSALDVFVGCDVSAMPQQPAALYAAALLDYQPDIAEVAARYATKHGLTIPFFASLIGPSASVPAPQPFQVGLSQVVSAGQPGMQAVLGGAPGAKSDSKLWRHTMVHGSALIIQTPSTSTGERVSLGDPQFASGQLDVSYTSRRTLYDWSSETADQVVDIGQQLDRHALNAATRGLQTYAGEVKAGLARTTALADGVREMASVYRAAASAYFEDVLIRKELERDHDSHWDLGLRGRISPRPDFVPELPDLVSFGVVGGGELALGSPTATHFALSTHGLLALSMFPTTIYRRIDKGDRDGDLSGLFDYSLDMALLVPGALAAAGRTRVACSGLLRYAFRTVSGQPEISAGANATIEVPLSGTIALAGTYTMRWINERGVESISALTIAKAFAE
jgi:hypothetical protein